MFSKETSKIALKKVEELINIASYRLQHYKKTFFILMGTDVNLVRILKNTNLIANT